MYLLEPQLKNFNDKFIYELYTQTVSAKQQQKKTKQTIYELN